MLKEVQSNGERDYLIKQKEAIENILLEMDAIKIHPFNIFGFIKKIKRIILILGSSVVSYIIKLSDLSQNDSDICKMIESQQKQISILNERIKKLER